MTSHGRSPGVSTRWARAGIVAIMLLLVSDLWPQTTSAVDRSIVVLLDVSYSMGLRSDRSGQRRIDVAVRATRELARRCVAGEEWALMAMEDRSAVEVLGGFTFEPGTKLDWRRATDPQGSTPLGAALERAASYLLAKGRGEEKRILLVSDGIATEDDAFRLPNPGYFRVRGVPVTALLCRVADMESVQEEVRSFATETGGAAFDAESVAASEAYPAVLTSLRTPTASERAAEKTAPASPAAQLVASPAAPADLGRRLPGVLIAGTAGGAPAASSRARVRVLPEDRAVSRLQTSSISAQGRQITFRLIWLAAPLLVIAAWRLSRRVARLLAALGTPKSTVSYRSLLRLDVRSAGGGSGPVVLRTLPALVGGSDRAHLRLESRSSARRAPDFELQAAAEGVVFRCPSALNINGVAKTHKILRPGDCIAVDGHRVIFQALATERVTTRRPAPDVGVPWELALLGAALLVGLLLWKPVTVTLPRKQLERKTVTEVLRVQVPALVVSTAPEVGQSMSPAVPGVAIRGALRLAAASGSAAAGSVPRAPALRVRLEAPKAAVSAPPTPSGAAGGDVPLYLVAALPLKREAVTTFAPGERIEYSPVDALFVHAHPDDESIDFGILISRLSAAGKRLAVVLLTDGESGLDQYPDRIAEGMYTARSLRPEELRAVRPVEARNAIGDLGARYYVRLGLRNHPYASIRQVLSRDTLLADWGGEEAVVAKLTEIIEGFAPALIVSPDSEHSGAHEHFEHTGAGYLVAEAIRRVRLRGHVSPVAHFRSVDPRFLGSYVGAEGIDGLERRGDTGLTLRALQVRALKEHRTQRDATLIAVENLTSVRREYYVATFWGEQLTLERFLRTW